MVRYKDGKVDLKVTTRDVWTLDPGISFGRSGGTNSTGVKLEEVNLLGTGAALNLSHTSDVDRSGNSIEPARLARLWQLGGLRRELMRT